MKKFVIENRDNPTKTEQILWEALKEKKLGGYKFRGSILLVIHCGFCMLIPKLVIEIDGLIHQLPENKRKRVK
jgi:5-methyltetrahydrofolate--homocysteine methyltransferase